MSLFPFLAISWLLIIASIILLIHILRIKFPYFWLLSTFAVLVAWVLVLLSRAGMPYIQNSASLLPAAASLGIPSLIVDGISWPYALVLITLSMVVYLSLVTQATQMDWLSLMGGLALTACGLLAIQSLDATTIMSSWAAIDIVEFILLFSRISDRDRIDGLIKAFALRIIGIMLFFWGISDPTVLILAAGIRLIVIPAGIYSEKELNLPRSMVYFLTLISPVSALIVFTRIALTITPAEINPMLFISLMIIGLMAGIAWFTASDGFNGRRYWVLALGSFVVMSALRGLLIASVSWGVAMILSGGILFFDEKTFRKPLFSFIGILAITSIPFMPTWDGASLYTSAPGFSMVFFILIQSLIISGYFKHMNANRPKLANPERWIPLLNSWRMIMIIFVYWLIAFLYWRDGVLLSNSLPWLLSKQIIDYFIGFVIVIISLFIFLLWRNQNRLPEWIKRRRLRLVSFDWFYKSGNTIFQLIGKVMDGLSSLNEGESGILLTLLLLALLITFFIQGGQ